MTRRQDESGCCQERSGFTLIELLVVLAIIGLLMALLLPAVQMAREAARRTQCQNNLRQIGIALQNYSSMHVTFPYGWMCAEYDPSGCPADMAWPYMWSGWPMLLPFLEQSNLYNGLNFDLESNHPSNTSTIAQALEVFVCPSYTDPKRIPVQSNPADPTSSVLYYAGLSNYKGNMAAGLRGDCNDPLNPLCQIFDNGVFYRNSSTGFRDFTDGTSATVLAGESIEGLWSDATYCCVRTSPERALNQKQQGLFTLPRYWNSMHPGGVHFVFGDSSVRMINETIDNKVLIALMTRAGTEPLDDGDY